MNTPRKHSQQGVALVVSLIILVSLTMLGLTTIQRTTTDLAMAGNQRETGLMFQSAEVGLVNAENFIKDSNTTADFSNEPLGLYEVPKGDTSYNGPDYFNPATWAAKSQSTATSLNAYEQPRYMIEYLGDRDSNGAGGVNIQDYTSSGAGEIVSIYRSTSRGTGLTGNSFRYVQAYFGKEKFN
jgi:type IV pilus assembly protein PilX